jgi:hypothetical protein
MHKARTKIRIRMITYLVRKPNPLLHTPRSHDSKGVARVFTFREDGKNREKMRSWRMIESLIPHGVVVYAPISHMPRSRGQRPQRSRVVD